MNMHIVAIEGEINSVHLMNVKEISLSVCVSICICLLLLLFYFSSPGLDHIGPRIVSIFS
jgi:hypothetical protein